MSGIMRKRLVSIDEPWDELIDSQLTEYGSPAAPQLSKEDERSAALARRAQQGDYDDGMELHL